MTVGVLHIVDSLACGGTETVAVNLANQLPGAYRSYLCSTRRGGPLLSSLNGRVQYTCLNRKSTADLGAALRLSQFIAEKNIRVLHAHSSSLFLARLALLLSRSSQLRLVWHDHYGRCESNDRPAWMYRLVLARASGVIAVNQRLADWARFALQIPGERVWFVPNFVPPEEFRSDGPAPLPGSDGSRIVCVANFRPQKDHFTLLRAFAIVRRTYPQAHLLLAGAVVDDAYARAVRAEATKSELDTHVTFLGEVRHVDPILRGSDIGVLSSASEGLPLSLLEYGRAGLASVATRVGQCSDVLAQGEAGVLVEPKSPEQLAAAIGRLLESERERWRLGEAFRELVERSYSSDSVVKQICAIYERVLS